MEESLISWNFPNVVSIILMIMIIWIIGGVLGHTLFRSANAGNQKSSGSTNGNPAVVLGA